MRTHRPRPVVWLSNFAILATVVDAMSAQVMLSAPSNAEWVAANASASRVQLLISYALAALTLLAAYFMMFAKNWARWTYLGISAARYAMAVLLLLIDLRSPELVFLTFRGSMVPGMIIFLLSWWVLFTADARRYFSEGGRAWWQVEEDLERKRASRHR